MQPTPPRVFISYSHESTEHVARVLKLANNLRRDGVDAVIDRYITCPTEGWISWMATHIRDDRFVLLVCSETYYKQIEQNKQVSPGLGVTWECNLIYNHIYRTKCSISRFVPVLLHDGKIDHIPVPLLGAAHYFVETPNGYGGLLRQLFECPEEQMPPIGKQPMLRALRAQDTDIEEMPDFTDNNLFNLEDKEPRKFCKSITRYFREIHKNIEHLTTEQYRVIRMLRMTKRVRVCGCAGSGKTLVAIEKAIRLAQSGLDVLFLCHNPHLAQYISIFISDVSVQVFSYGEWVAKCANAFTNHEDKLWSNYNEPDPATLGIAFDRLVTNGGCYDAIIVDEGQDFREEWWATVEAGLKAGCHGILYIFHDDKQAILPHRAKYPILDTVVDLSRNCRNAGTIFDIVKCLYPHAPEPEALLHGKGLVKYFMVKGGEEYLGLRTVLEYISGIWFDNCDVVVLLAGGLTFSNSKILDHDICIRTTESWQLCVRRYFEKCIASYSSMGVTAPQNGIDIIREMLGGLSDDITPTAIDIDIVMKTTRIFTISHEIRRKILGNSHFRRALRWRTKGQRLHLKRSDPTPMWSAEIIMHFERDDWALGLPRPRVLRPVRESRSYTADMISIYEINTFKGLESEVIILIDGGYRPMSEEELYVAISRPRSALILIDCGDIGRKIPMVQRFAVGS